MKIGRGKLTNDSIVEHARRFTSKSAWERASADYQSQGLPSPYKCAVRRGIFKLATAHMANGKRPRQITDDEIVASAAQFPTIKAWREKFNNLYTLASYRKILERATAHMERLPSPYSGSYQIYAYEFQDKSVYVGLTCFPGKRHESHTLLGPVFEYSKETGATPELVVKHTEVETPNRARELEAQVMEEYSQAGFRLLNSAQAGSLGSAIRWTHAKIAADAQKHRTRTSWMSSSIGAYAAARRLGIFDEVTAHMPKRSKPQKSLTAILVTGVSGSGKTWVADQLSGCKVVRYDDDHFSFSARVAAAFSKSGVVVCETGFRCRELIRAFQHVEFRVAVVDSTVEQIRENLARRGGGQRFDETKCQKYLQSTRRFGRRHQAFVGTPQEVLAEVRRWVVKRR